MPKANMYHRDRQDGVPTDDVTPSSFRAWVFRVARVGFWLSTAAGGVGILTAWVWRMLLLPADGSVSALVAMWSIILTSFWWQIGVAALVPVLLGWVLRARIAAFAWLLLSVLCLGPTLLSAFPARTFDPVPTADSDGAIHDLGIYSANLLYGRSDLAIIETDIRASTFDVLLFQEVTPDAARSLIDCFQNDFPHRVVLPRHDAFGQAVFSRVPFSEPPRAELPLSLLPDQPFPTTGVTLSVGGHMVEIWNVHTVPPMGRSAVRHQDRMCRAIALMLVENANGKNRPMVFGGDFNSPEAGAPVRCIARVGAKPHAYRPGAWVRPTWPAPMDSPELVFVAASMMGGTRLDHILATEHFVSAANRPGSANGSDHLPMIFTAQLGSKPRVASQPD